MRLGLCESWDGPFEFHLKDDYQEYLGRRLAYKLGSAERVHEWMASEAVTTYAAAMSWLEAERALRQRTRVTVGRRI